MTTSFNYFRHLNRTPKMPFNYTRTLKVIKNNISWSRKSFDKNLKMKESLKFRVGRSFFIKYDNKNLNRLEI